MVEITTEEQAEFDHEMEVSEDFLCSVLDEMPEDVDEMGVLFSLWVSITRILAEEYGWTGEELARDAQHHAASATSQGCMQ